MLGSFNLPDYTPFGYLLESTNLLFEFYRLKEAVVYDYSVFYTCNLSILKSAVIEAGLFDETFSGPSSEDIDLGYRLYKQGYKVLYQPQCKTAHCHNITPLSYCKLQTVRGREIIRKFAKHPELAWYRGIDRNTIELWRKVQHELEDNVTAITAEIDNINSYCNKTCDRKEIKQLAVKILPAVRYIHKYYARKGSLTSPYLDDFLNALKNADSNRPRNETPNDYNDVFNVANLIGVENLNALLKSAMEKELKMIIASDTIKDRQVYIWGAGQGGIRTLDMLDIIGIKAAGFIDSDSRKQTSTIKDIPVYSPSALKKISDRPFVFIGSMYEDEISAELERMGFIKGADFSPNVILY
ncbi:glycosyl transferase group 1/2 family protein [Candidatus Magnetoovum chiemensis]|nr:glycosyl transferase group 1/2 family protein [Candidatus Magnetoovum chiemensis]